MVQLNARELENVWLDPRIVHRIMADLARDAAARLGESIDVPSEDAVARLLSAHDPEKEKGSDGLAAVAAGFKLRFDKIAAAQHAVVVLRELAPTRAEFLCAEVRRAFANRDQ